MNDLHTRRANDADLKRPLHGALAAIMDTAPATRTAPTDPNLLDQYQPANDRPRLIVGAAAAAVLVVGIGGLTVMRQSDDPAVSDSSPDASAPSATGPTTSGPTDPTTTTTASADPLATATGFVLPTYVPEGYEITNLAAYPATPSADPDVGRWLSTEDRGVSQFSVSVQPAASQPDLELRPNATIHGQPAMSFDSGEGIVVTWVEGDWIVSARGRNLSVNDTLAAAEALVLDAAGPTVNLPDGALPGFNRQDPNPVVMDNTVATGLGLTRTDGLPGGFISAASMPNTSGDTLDTMQARGDGYERRIIGGIERLVRIQAPDSLGPFTSVEWIDGDAIISVTGRAPSEEVIAVAEGITQVSSDEFAAAGAAITTTAARLDVLDQTTFDDGLTVSVRSLTPGETGSGAIAICVDAPIERCRLSFSETSLGGAYQHSILAAFDINGQTILIAWDDTAEAERLGEPTLSPSGIVTDPSQAQPATTTAQIDQQVTTAAGRFTRINVPAGEQPPQINYTTGDGKTGMSTTAPSSYDF
ncbi:MAG: hypothetical protein R8G01_15240 [Ilumatobacteraceae bacterium]|nr:hypothetical protein [Ilumatobacteraceae bacterium]